VTKPKKTSPVDKSRNLVLLGKTGQTEDEVVAASVTSGIGHNAGTVIDYSAGRNAGLCLTSIARSLEKTGAEVNRGDLAALERMLTAQAVALNTMFTELARRGALNMRSHLGATETYIRLALKAQSQSRATVETLGALKNPPVVFARQANINNGGQQQVNNGSNGTPAHAAESVSQPDELLGDSSHGLTQVDARATTAAGRAHQDVEAVGAVNRAAQR
jgi:hypothetical protein